ncbi:N-acetylmuramoyl-L-alanine amidase-like domain-containing protein [Gloeothece verrucosa]|uniref:DUF1460 domain-containing protein n=1 Tax=Gloeothece verrucosa (strain PCC 7822) TaxID=497965 RepID=E0UJN9_GLOV7|nr:N-acetylmuramoyl-L-alanine amidase-like domain-containing protein [Gloeothece verrucosa]ADN12283.1 protein of unknown function DUF1460 [Gloeothece verrucosa PCC 7822]
MNKPSLHSLCRLAAWREIKTPFLLALSLIISLNIAPKTTSTEQPPIITQQQQNEQQKDFQQLINYAATHQLNNKSMGQIMQAIAHQLLGSQYKAGLLEQTPEESLFISLKQFDCLLFVETVLALSRNIAQQDYTYPTFTHHIQDTRYRQGKLDGYCSRLHYFSEWIEDNQKRGNIQNITASLGGIPLKKTLNFMSTHRQAYRQLKSHTNYECILQVEKNLESLKIRYIPQPQIRQIYNQLQPGDIIGVATNLSGLDVTHTGLVYRFPNGKIGFIHASPAGQVTIAADLQQYIKNVNHAVGIIVARPLKN